MFRELLQKLTGRGPTEPPAEEYSADVRDEPADRSPGMPSSDQVTPLGDIPASDADPEPLP